jgi:hypothetical protein
MSRIAMSGWPSRDAIHSRVMRSSVRKTPCNEQGRCFGSSSGDAVMANGVCGHRGFGGSFGFCTPVVSYAPRPMLYVVDGLDGGIMESLSQEVRNISRKGYGLYPWKGGYGLTHDFWV